MSSESFLESKMFKNIMSKVYGLGAAIVIVGALFKIMHWPGASIMLIFGLGTEAVIFAISAFQPLHEDPDWSLVYPELNGHDEDLLDEVNKIAAEHDAEENAKIAEGHGHGSSHGHEHTTGSSEFTSQNRDAVSQQLDKMLEAANIGPELIESLGAGMKNLSENVSKIGDITNVAVSATEFTDELQSVKGTTTKFKEALEADILASEKLADNINDVAQSAKDLTSSYSNISYSLGNFVTISDKFTNNLEDASHVASDMVINYTSSAQKLAESAQNFEGMTQSANLFLQKLELIANNLSSLNVIYEKQLLVVANQTDQTQNLNNSFSKFKENIEDSIEDTMRYKTEVTQFNDNLSKMNGVYGNMLKAMTFNGNGKKPEETQNS